MELPNKPDIKCVDLTPNDKKVANFELSGKSIDASISNALRRVSTTYIPQYGFYRTGIIIDINKNTGLTNSELICQLEQLPIYDIESPDILLNPAEVLSQSQLEQIFGIPLSVESDDVIKYQNEPTKDSFIKTKKEIKMFISIKNTSTEPLLLTTHDIKLMINDKIVNNYTKHPPVLIVRLRAGGELSLMAEAYIGFQRMKTCWQAACRSVSITKDNKWYLKFISLGQISKTSIYIKACTILLKKITNLKNFIVANSSKLEEVTENGEKKITFALFNEDDTLGNVIASTLRKDKRTLRAGYAKPHQQQRQIIIQYDILEKEDKVKILVDTLIYLADLFTLLSNVHTK